MTALADPIRTNGVPLPDRATEASQAADDVARRRAKIRARLKLLGAEIRQLTLDDARLAAMQCGAGIEVEE